MDFFIFLEGNLAQSACVRYTPAEKVTTIRDALELFSQHMQKEDQNFSYTKYKVYVDDFMNPVESHPLKLIENYDTPISSLNSYHFDIVLSEEEPLPTHGSSQSDVETHQQDAEFIECIQSGKARLDMRDFKSAIQLFHKARKLDKSSPIPLHNQIIMFMKMHRFKTAMDLATTAAALFPEDRKCQLLLAKAHQRAGLHEEAIDCYKRLLLFAPMNQQNYDEINCEIAQSLIALKQLEEAQTLLQPIVNSVLSNLKANILLAKILARQGRFTDALHIAMVNFTIDPDHKGSKKFLGEHIWTERQAQLLKSEIGDSRKDPHVLFFLGFILDEHGSLLAAKIFYDEAFELCSADPAVAVGWLKNALYFKKPEVIIKTFEKCKEYVSALSERDPIFAEISKGVEYDPSQRPVSEVKAPRPIQHFEYGTEEPAFTVEQLDSIWFLMLYQQLLFVSNFVDQAEVLGINLMTIVTKYNLSRSVINQYVPTFAFITSLLPTIERPLKLDLPCFYVIGDEHCLPLAYRTTKYEGQEYVLIPEYIPKLRISEFSYHKANPVKTAFQYILESLPEGANVMFCVGEIDCSDGLFWATDKPAEVVTLEDALTFQIETIIKIAHKIIEKKNANVWIHPMIHMFNAPFKIVYDFNEKLKESVNSSSMQQINLHMLYIFNDLIEGEGDEVKIKTEYQFNSTHLIPAYSNIIEKGLVTKTIVENTNINVE